MPIARCEYFVSKGASSCCRSIHYLSEQELTLITPLTVSYLARDFWSALSDKEADKFYDIMWKFVGSMVLLAPITVAYRYQRQKLAIAWRKWLTGRVLRLYFSNKVYYALERQSGVAKSVDDDMSSDYNDKTKEIDNPDQRITEDIRSFTEFSLSFFLTMVTSIIDLVAFSFILFSIMPQLFIAIFAFASIGTFLTVLIGKVLIRLNYESLQKEADFRFSLVRVRENSESIAFYAGEDVETVKMLNLFFYCNNALGYQSTQISFIQ